MLQRGAAFIRQRLIVLHPAFEYDTAFRDPRPKTLEGLKVGLLDISKMKGDVFLDRLAELVRERGAEVLRFKKPTFTKPAPIDLRQEIAVQCDAVVEALAD